MAKCPNCGTINPDGQKFCGECGTPIPQTKKCPQCGKEWPATQKFCGECGFNFNAAAATPAPAPAAPTPDPEENKEYESIGEEETREGIFIDQRDGERYNVVKIGKQLWFAENFRGECDGVHVYDCDLDNLETYGGLYSWDSAKSVVPDGWRLPTRKDFNTLYDFISKLTEEKPYIALMSSTSDWEEGMGTDLLGFCAKPGGNYVFGDGGDDSFFDNMGYSSSFWTADEENPDSAFALFMSIGEPDENFRWSTTKKNGYSVRFVKDIDKVEVGEIFWTKIRAAGESDENEDSVGMTPLSEEDQKEMEEAAEIFLKGNFKEALEKITPVFHNNSNNFDVYKWSMRIVNQLDKNAAYDIATDGDIAENICDASFIRIEHALANEDPDEAIEILDEAKEKWPENPLVFTADVMIGCYIYNHEGNDERLEEAKRVIYDNMQVGLEGDEFEKASCFDYAEWLIAKADRKPLPTIEMDCWHYMAFPKSKSIEIIEED